MNAYFLRLQNAVDTIYQNTSKSTPYRGGICRLGKGDLYRTCAKALISEGYLVKYGTPESPVYFWKGKNLDDITYHKVFHWIHNYSRQ